MRGGARPGAGRPRIYEDGVRSSVTMSRRHWEGLKLLARMVGSTPSGVLCALVEQAVNEAAERGEVTYHHDRAPFVPR